MASADRSSDHSHPVVSDINDPAWRPGRGIMRKAKRRAAKFGITFDAALVDQIKDAKAAVRIALAANERVSVETRAMRAELEPDDLERRLDRMLGL